jgi:DNA (cytosine-5)-methyltransferase 1
MRSVELFAGAGGLGLGLQAAGFEPVQVVERDRFCCDTVRRNQARHSAHVRNWNLVEGDVRQVSFLSFEDRLELVSGGPPCQPFSMGGRHRSHADRRDMFPEAIRAVREARPKAFIFENVKGLTRSAFRSYFEYIRLQLTYPEVVQQPAESWEDHLQRLERHHTTTRTHGLCYNVVSQVLNAADFGIPQRRERVFFVGFRADLDASWSFPQPTHSHALLKLSMQNGSYWERHGLPHRTPVSGDRDGVALTHGIGPKLPWKTVRDALSGLPDPELDRSGSTAFPDHRFQAGARSYPGHTGSPIDLPAKTLKAGVHGVPGGENMLLRDDGSVRYFTIRESARLQTFPDDFVFHGSWTETMRQLGNAVPVQLAQIVGASVAAELKRLVQ